MPVTTDNHRDMSRLNVVFAVSAVLLTFSTFWMIWVDYNRPWKNTQDKYMNAEASLAHLQFMTTQTAGFKAKIDAAQAVVDQNDPNNNDSYTALLTQLSDLEDQHYGLDLEFKEKDALIVVRRSEFEKALALDGADSPITHAISETLSREEQALVDSRLTKEQVEDEIRMVKNQIKGFDQDYRDAKRALSDLQKRVDEASKKRDRFSSLLNKSIFNAPLLDFTAPKGTPGRHEVKQFVAYDVKTKLNFLDGYKVDRCTTCHVVMDNPNFSTKSLVSSFEQAIPAIQEFLAQSGAGPTISMPAPPKLYGVSEEQSTGRVAEHWQRVSKPDRDAYFDALQEQINSYLAHEGMPTIDLGHPLRAHPNLDLFLTPDSPHPVATMGCTVCHEGNGQETDFILASHTPKTYKEKKEWTKKHYDRNLGVPTATWKTLAHYWDFPMIPPTYSEASCAKCHTELNDIAHFEGNEYATKVRRGQALFRQVGCINCHKVENIDNSRQVGPDLAHIGSKVSDGFLHNWIYKPQDFRPSTWMPHFFMQENNGPGSENTWDPDPELRTKAEVVAMTHYLKAASQPWTPQAAPDGLVADVANGQQLFANTGCLACHSNMAEYGERWIVDDLTHRYRSEDSRLTKLATLQADLKHNREKQQRLRDQQDNEEQLKQLGYEKDSLTTQIGDLETELEDAQTDFEEKAASEFAAMDLNEQVRYALKHFTEDRHKAAQEQASEEELLASLDRRDPDPLRLYVPPMFTRFAPDLSGIGSKVTTDWLYSWLKEPRHYASYTKMPKLRLTDQEALDIAGYLQTLKHDSFDQAPFAVDDRLMAEVDRRMTDLLSGQNSSSSIERIKSDSNGVLSNGLITDMSRSSDKAKQASLEAHFGSVVGGMTIDERKLLFLGQKMITHYGCYACHTVQGYEDAARPGTEVTTWGEKNLHQLDFAFFGGAWHHSLGETEEFATLYPQDDNPSLTETSRSGNIDVEIGHTHASFAYHKLLNPRIWDREKIKRPYEKLKMPNFYFSEEEADALVTYLLSRRPARVAESLQIDYDNELSGPIAKGRHLVTELNCVGCHKIEDNVSTMHQFITLGGGDGEGDDFDDFDFDDEEEDEEAEEEAEEDSAVAKLGSGFGGEFDLVNAPPWLRGQGAKVQPQWFHGFLQNVEILRPWPELKVRMPSFYLNDEDTAAIVGYFAALSQAEAEDLSESLRVVHSKIERGGDSHEQLRQWHRSDKNIAEQFADYAVDNELLLKRQLDFRRKSEEQVDDVYSSILGHAEFFSELYDIEYPLEFQGFTGISDDRFKTGERLFYELRCLKCHVLGDPTVPGSTPNPTAPNLALTHKRLRYDWFSNWLENPQRIQPGTKMPQLFPDGRSAFADVPDGDREPLESAYGSDGDEQMRLLMDFVWQAGEDNYTAVQPDDSAAGQAVPSTAQAGPRRINGAVTNDSSIGPRPTMQLQNPASGGSISGRVIWQGDNFAPAHLPVAPKHRDTCSDGQPTKAAERLQVNATNGGVGRAVVYLAGRHSIMPPFNAKPVTEQLSIDACQFDKPISIVGKGSTVRIHNTDDVPHHIRGRIGQTLIWSKRIDAGASADFTADKIGIVEVRSGSGFDWMASTIWIVDHAGIALTDSNGRFQIDEVPANEYILHVWHPGVALSTEATDSNPQDPAVGFEPPRVRGGTIEVKDNQTTEVVIELE